MTAKKNQIDSPQVVENDVDDESTEDYQTEAMESKPADDGLAKLEVTLSNGVELTLDVIKDQGDWAYEAVEAMAEMNYPVLVNAIITRGSKFKLKAAGARVRDFELITDKVSEAIGIISDEKADAEKNKK